MKKHQIYPISRASIPARSAMWRRLRDEGWPIVASWIDEAGPGESLNREALLTRCFEEIVQATAVIMYVEITDLPLKIAFGEACIALEHRIPIHLVAEGVHESLLGLEPHSLVYRWPTVDAALWAAQPMSTTYLIEHPARFADLRPLGETAARFAQEYQNDPGPMCACGHPEHAHYVKDRDHSRAGCSGRPGCSCRGFAAQPFEDR